MYIPTEQRPANPALQALPATVDAAPVKLAAEAAMPPIEPIMEAPKITEELLIEEVSIDGMCGVY